jgi:hypothetical protein
MATEVKRLPGWFAEKTPCIESLGAIRKCGVYLKSHLPEKIKPVLVFEPVIKN